MSTTSRKRPLFPAGRDTSTGPYTPALCVDPFVFVSGQGPLDPETHQVTGSTLEEQAELTLTNVKTLLAEAGCTMDDCVKVTVHLADMRHYDRFNRVYERFFRKPFPTRTLVQSGLLDILVEIDAIAIKGAGGKGRETET